MSGLAVYVINMARSTRRMASIASQLQSIDLPFQRIEAVDGKLIENPETLGYCTSINQARYHKPLNLGEIGCILSHRKALESFLLSEHSCALILEDDAVIGSELVPAVTSLADTSDHWDIIKLYAGKKAKKAIEECQLTPAVTLATPQKTPHSTIAQLISRSGAEKLLKLYRRFGEPADVAMKHWWQHDLTILMTQPSIVVPEDEDSEIDIIAKRTHLKTSSVKRLWQKCGYEIGLRWHKPKSLAPITAMIEQQRASARSTAK